MTKKFYFLSLFLGLVCGMCFTSCGSDDDPVVPPTPSGGGSPSSSYFYLDVNSIAPEYQDQIEGCIVLPADGSLELKFEVSPAELASQIVLTSADPNIVAVDGLKVIAKGAGKTTITAKAGEKQFVFEVKVKESNAYLKWNADQKKLVATEIPAEVTMVQNSDENVEWAAGTYVVEGNVTIGGEITLTGDVNLIIKDGAKLTVNQIYGGSSKYNLSIYGQANQTGQLVVNSSSSSSGSNKSAIINITTLEVHSCKVTATSSWQGWGGFDKIGTFNVYGGSVYAECTASTMGYGISLDNNGSMNIYGGDVKAVGKGDNNGYSYGIRSYSSSIADEARVKVYGGKLWAECATNKALKDLVTLTKDASYTSGKIQTSDNGESWTDYTTTGTPTSKYVRVGH